MGKTTRRKSLKKNKSLKKYKRGGGFWEMLGFKPKDPNFTESTGTTSNISNPLIGPESSGPQKKPSSAPVIPSTPVIPVNKGGKKHRKNRKGRTCKK
jgi:hypothetical protein